MSTLLTVNGQRDPTLDFGFWIPAPDVEIVKGDAAGNAADEEATAVVLPDGTASLVFTVRNSGTEALVDVTVSDVVISNGVVTDLTCSFPDATSGTSWAGPFAVGDTFDCAAALSGVEPGAVHQDVATVVGTGDVSGTVVDDDDPYHALTPVTTTTTTTLPPTTTTLAPTSTSTTAPPTTVTSTSTTEPGEVGGYVETTAPDGTTGTLPRTGATSPA